VAGGDCRPSSRDALSGVARPPLRQPPGHTMSTWTSKQRECVPGGGPQKGFAGLRGSPRRCRAGCGKLGRNGGGTPEYMSPRRREGCRDDHPLRHYSMGASAMHADGTAPSWEECNETSPSSHRNACADPPSISVPPRNSHASCNAGKGPERRSRPRWTCAASRRRDVLHARDGTCGP